MTSARPSVTRVGPPVPARAGVGLKPQHYRDILESAPDLGFFEIHAENYMGAGGPPHRWLEAVRARYPLSLHGVAMSIGAARSLDRDHLARFRDLVRRYEPGLVTLLLDFVSFALLECAPSIAFIPQIQWQCNGVYATHTFRHARCHRKCLRCKPCPHLPVSNVGLGSAFETL